MPYFTCVLSLIANAQYALVCHGMQKRTLCLRECLTLARVVAINSTATAQATRYLLAGSCYGRAYDSVGLVSASLPS